MLAPVLQPEALISLRTFLTKKVPVIQAPKTPIFAALVFFPQDGVARGL